MSWRKHLRRKGLQSEEPDSDALYNPPLLSNMKPHRWQKFIPILPQFDATCSCRRRKVGDEPVKSQEVDHENEMAHEQRRDNELPQWIEEEN